MADSGRPAYAAAEAAAGPGRRHLCERIAPLHLDACHHDEADERRYAARLTVGLPVALPNVRISYSGEGDMATHGHPGKYTWLVAHIAPCTEREPAHHTMPAGGMHEPRLDAVTGGPGVKTTMAPQLHAALFPSAKSITRRERPRRAGVEQTPAPA